MRVKLLKEGHIQELLGDTIRSYDGHLQACIQQALQADPFDQSMFARAMSDASTISSIQMREACFVSVLRKNYAGAIQNASTYGERGLLLCRLADAARHNIRSQEIRDRFLIKIAQIALQPITTRPGNNTYVWSYAATINRFIFNIDSLFDSDSRDASHDQLMKSVAIFCMQPDPEQTTRLVSHNIALDAIVMINDKKTRDRLLQQLENNLGEDSFRKTVEWLRANWSHALRISCTYEKRFAHLCHLEKELVAQPDPADGGKQFTEWRAQDVLAGCNRAFSTLRQTLQAELPRFEAYPKTSYYRMLYHHQALIAYCGHLLELSDYQRTQFVITAREKNSIAHRVYRYSLSKALNK